jgi:branched-chain amino acid transport system permease protein
VSAVDQRAAAPAPERPPAAAAPSRRPAWRRLLPLLPAVAVLALLPYLLTPFYLAAATSALVLGLFALSVDLLLSSAGIASLGHAVFFGLGSYAAGLVAIHISANVLPMLAIACAAAVAGALLTAWIVARSSGAYLVMITIAVGALFSAGATQWRSLTGGTDGLVGIPPAHLPGGGPLTGTANVYWLVLAGFALGAVGIHVVRVSPFGRALRGIRDNEARMRALGYYTTLYKYAAICGAALFAGLAGTLSTVSLQYTSPADLGFVLSTTALIAVIVGGSGTWWGPLLGATIITFVGVLLPSSLGAYENLFVGAIFIAVVYLLPGGFTGLWQKLRVRWGIAA